MKLINTEDYLLLIDEEASMETGRHIVSGNVQLKQGWNYGFHFLDEENLDHFKELQTVMRSFLEKGFKTPNVMTEIVIAHLPLKGKKIEGLLSLPELPKIPYDVEEAIKKIKPTTLSSSFDEARDKIDIAQRYFRKGYIEASKQYSLDDMREALRTGVNIGMQNVDKPRYPNDFNFNQKKALQESIEYLNSVSTTKLPTSFEPEIIGAQEQMENMGKVPYINKLPVRVKGNILKGRYIYEKE